MSEEITTKDEITPDQKAIEQKQSMEASKAQEAIKAEDEAKETINNTLEEAMAAQLAESAGKAVPEETPAVEPVEPVATEEETVTDTETTEETPVETPAVEPEKPAEETKPDEVAIPEWAKDCDLGNELEVDTINHFLGGGTEEWMRQEIGDMTEEQQEHFRKVQGAYDKAEMEKTKAVQATKIDIPQESMQRAAAKVEALKQGNPQLFNLFKQYADDSPIVTQPGTVATPETAPEPVMNAELMKKYNAAQEEGDTDKANALMVDIVQDTAKRTEQTIMSRLDTVVEQRLNAKLNTVRQSEYEATLERQANALVARDSRARKYLSPDSTYADGSPSCPLGRVMDMRIGPNGEDVSDMDNAFKWILKNNGGNGGPKLTVTRPSDDAQPAPGSGVGDSAPDMSEADMNLSLADFSSKVMGKILGNK